MIQEKINGHIVLIEDDIAELSIKRFQKYNKFMLIESGIGSDLNAICSHIDKATTLIKGNSPLAITELNNIKQALYLTSQELTPRYMAFACLIMRIDGQPINDLSDENLKGIVRMLSTEKHRLLDRLINAVKKKISEALETYFPQKFDVAEVKQYYDELKELTLLKLRAIKGENTAEQQAQQEFSMATLLRPQSFAGTDNAEIRYDKEFEEMCLVISKELHIAEPKKMSVMEFYNATEHLKRLQKEREKALKTKR